MGFAVVANAPAALAATALLAGCLFLAIRAEEKALVDRFGHLYEDYAGRVGRIFVNPPNGPDPQLDGPEPGGTP